MLLDDFPALLPHDVPVNALPFDSRQHEKLSLVLNVKGGASPNITPAIVADAIERTLARIPDMGELAENPAGQPDDLAHDAYFRVKRVNGGNDSTSFLRTILIGRRTLLREVEAGGVNIGADHLECIDQSFADLLSCLVGGEVNGVGHIESWAIPNGPASALRRWVCGHHIFLALTQGLIVSFQSLGRALRAGQSKEVKTWADLSISLLNGSSSTFLLTGDFAPEEYENTIRPSMTPPVAPIGLSGLMSIDHRYMAQIIRDMRPVLNSLADRDPERHERIGRAVSEVYDSHVYVCERFVGERPSLLTEGRTERTGPSLSSSLRPYD